MIPNMGILGSLCLETRVTSEKGMMWFNNKTLTSAINMIKPCVLHAFFPDILTIIDTLNHLNSDKCSTFKYYFLANGKSDSD